MPFKYRVRMSCLQWFVRVYDKSGNEILPQTPYSSYEAAVHAAQAAGLFDWDKMNAA